MQHLKQPVASRSMGISFILVLICFFLSGFSGLIYETAWSQEFVLVFGSTEMAIAVVLAAFMGGLAIGAMVASRYLIQTQRPILLYAWLELGIAGSAILVPYAIRLAGHMQVILFRSSQIHSGTSGWLLTYDLVTSFLILIIPTGIMGATLPLLARFAIRRKNQISGRIAWLYTINTFGAAMGALAAAFWLLPHLGLQATILLAVGINVLVFGFAILLAKRRSSMDQETPDSLPQRETTVRWIYPLMLVSGMVSFSLEIMWTRLLSHILGGSIYAFGTMLATYLIAIALGAVVAGRLAREKGQARVWFILAQVGVAVGTLVAFALADRLPELAKSLGAQVGNTMSMGVLLSAVTLFPAAFCGGMTFPCAVRLASNRAEDAARASGTVYAWNTLGAILGAVGASFWFLPVLGYANTIRLCTAISLFLALLALVLSWKMMQTKSAGSDALPMIKQPRLIISVVGATLLIGGIFWIGFRKPELPWQVLRSSPLSQSIAPGEIAYFGVGRSANVMVSRHGRDWRLSTNGLPESIIQTPGALTQSLSVARWLSLLPHAVNPDLKKMMVIGFGAGVTVDNLPVSIEEVQVVELEPEIIRANQALNERRIRDPLDDPRINLSFNDARSALLLADRRFEAIVSQPSHPWTSAASHLFTEEFFRLVQRRLTDDGVFIQWIGFKFVDEDLLKTLVATLQAVFPNVEVFAPNQRRAVLFLASQRRLPENLHIAQSLQIAGPQWARIGVSRPEDILMDRELNHDGAQRFSKGAPINRDRNNLLKIHSPKVLKQPISKEKIDRYFEPWDALKSETAHLDRVYIVRRLLEGGNVPRARRVAFATEDVTQRQLALGLIALAEGKRQVGMNALTRILQRDPTQTEALAGLVHFLKPKLVREPLTPAIQALLPQQGLDLIEGWKRESDSDWIALQSMESALTIQEPSHPLFSEMTRLRVLWRLKRREPGDLDEAEALLELLTNQSYRLETLIMRAKLAHTQENPEVFLATMATLRQLFAQRPQAKKRIRRELAQEIADFRQHYASKSGEWEATSLPGSNGSERATQ